MWGSCTQTRQSHDALGSRELGQRPLWVWELGGVPDGGEQPPCVLLEPVGLLELPKGAWALESGSRQVCAPEVKRQSPGKHWQEDRVRSRVLQGLWGPAEQGWLGVVGRWGF